MVQAFCLGKSQKGVCYGVVDYSDDMCRLRVWILAELCGKMEWVLKHQSDLQLLLTHHKYDKQSEGPWILQDTKYYDHIGWCSDNDNSRNEGMVDMSCGFIDFLGFHPYEDVVFLTHSLRRGLTYDLNNSKVEDLGNMYPRSYRNMPYYHACIRESFPYTPCWVEEFPVHT